MKQLFGAMATGGRVWLKKIEHFDGGLFADDDTVPLECDEIEVLAAVSRLDWSSIEPAIFGTLFERSLDPSRRSQLGAHCTSRGDPLLADRVAAICSAPEIEVRTRLQGLRAPVPPACEQACADCAQALREIAQWGSEARDVLEDDLASARRGGSVSQFLEVMQPVVYGTESTPDGMPVRDVELWYRFVALRSAALDHCYLSGPEGTGACSLGAPR